MLAPSKAQIVLPRKSKNHKVKWNLTKWKSKLRTVPLLESITWSDQFRLFCLYVFFFHG